MYACWSCRTRGGTRALLGLAVLAAVAIAGCGGGGLTHHGGAGGHHARAHAVAAKPTKVAGVPAPTGALPASRVHMTRLHAVHRGGSPRIQGLDNVAITQAIPMLSGDMNHFWSQEFASSGVQWPTVEDVLVQGSPVQTQCASRPTISPTDPWFLCAGSGTDTFYWTVPWMQQNVDTDSGGVNLALGMAGIYSDAVQDLFGFYQQLQSGSMTVAQWQQQNMCLTGVYAASLNSRRLFEQADAQTIANWLNALSGGGSSGAATPTQLRQAFAAGFNSGTPGTCGVSGGSSAGAGGATGGAGTTAGTGTGTGAATTTP